MRPAGPGVQIEVKARPDKSLADFVPSDFNHSKESESPVCPGIGLGLGLGCTDRDCGRDKPLPVNPARRDSDSGSGLVTLFSRCARTV